MHTVSNIAVLGSTGSIGRSALEVVAALPERLHVSYLTARRNTELLKQQIERFRPRAVAVMEEEHAASLRASINGSTEILVGQEGLRDIVNRPDVDTVVSALVGFAGLRPTLWALEAGKNVALANKETLVAGGEIIMQAAREKGGRLLPVDSEHSAIMQCLQGERLGTIERLILTASGGPFLRAESGTLAHVTVRQALNHPTWSMGNKITIDSATLMNKGLEVIEAFWLFGLPARRISVVIHPQSIIHSMVEFTDGSVKAQLGIPDMRLPIQYALTYPDRLPASHPRIDFAALGHMTFFAPDLERFRCLQLAYHALEMGGTTPAVLSAANEIAVEMFLAERIPFTGIATIIEDALERHMPIQHPGLNELLGADAETRAHVRQQTATVR